MIRSRTGAVQMLLLLMVHATGHAFLAAEQVEISVGIAVQGPGGSLQELCRDAATVAGRFETETWIVAGPLPGSKGDGVRCGSGASAGAAANPDERADLPAWSANVTTTARLVRQMEDEQNLQVEVAASLPARQGQGTPADEAGAYAEVNRTFVFSDGGRANVPLRVNDPTEPGAAQGREIFLTIAVVASEDRQATTRGSILLWTDLEGAGLYVDGGRAGTVEAGAEVVLRNLPAGVHLLEVRDAEDRRVRQSVRVLPRRTVLADLRHRESPDRPALEPLGANARGFEEFRRRTDRAVVVRIPAGEFLMGNAETERQPLEHTVWASDFLLDKTGVTWGQFKQFAAATGAPLPAHPPYWGIIDDHPAVYVSWAEAQNYCRWAWGRLPTEAEREKGARGTDGRKYPWGDIEPEPELAVFRRSWGFESTAPVGSHPAGASPYGLMDMGGNVWEWCADWYADDYYRMSPYRDPQGPDSGRARVVRGGSWDSRPSVLSASCRSWGHPGYRDGDFGFRCAMNAPGDSRSERAAPADATPRNRQ